jgi:hypothetical protein
VLTAYLDESWDQHQQKILVIGGMIGHYREWSKIEWSWKTLLDKYGIEHYRASDAEFARGQFGKEPFRTPNISATPAQYKNLTQSQRIDSVATTYPGQLEQTEHERDSERCCQ